MSLTRETRQAVRLIDFMSREGCAQPTVLNDEQTMLKSATGRSILVTAAGLHALVQAGTLEAGAGGISITVAGRARARRMAAVRRGADDRGFAGQHRAESQQSRIVEGERRDVTINDAESPLARLHLKPAPDGSPWVDDEALAAGERLRLDFTRAHLMQKITSSWDPTAGFSAKVGHGSGAGGQAELGDHVIDARKRLDAARDALGPDLAGVVLDVCCYLKGLQLVERERRWPARSAKLMLRTGLQVLVRHYGTRAGKRATS